MSETQGENRSQKVPQFRRAYRRGSGRERVLDAYAQVLRERGAGAATLEEVAGLADISKGGLLHHFGSKEDLAAGLVDRLMRENQENIERLNSSTANPVAAYLRGCMMATDTYSETYLAVLKLAGMGDAVVGQALERVVESWSEALRSWVDDDVTARMVLLVGEGLYLHAFMGYRAQLVDASVLKLTRELADDAGALNLP